MSFDKAAILARLQNGETVDAIAQEMSEALNAAKAENDALEARRMEEEKALEAKRAEEDRIHAAKREAVCVIIDGFSDYLIASGDEDLLAELQNVDPDKIVQMFDEMIEVTQSLARLKELEFPKAKDKDWDLWA